MLIGMFHRLVEMISSVINGATANRETIEPDEICASAEGRCSTQDEIDALFSKGPYQPSIRLQ